MLVAGCNLNTYEYVDIHFAFPEFDLCRANWQGDFNFVNSFLILCLVFFRCCSAYVKRDAATHVYYSYMDPESLKVPGGFPAARRFIARPASTFERSVNGQDRERVPPRTDFWSAGPVSLPIFRPSEAVAHKATRWVWSPSRRRRGHWVLAACASNVEGAGAATGRIMAICRCVIELDMENRT
jgi:hypothetical protein